MEEGHPGPGLVREGGSGSPEVPPRPSPMGTTSTRGSRNARTWTGSFGHWEGSLAGWRLVSPSGSSLYRPRSAAPHRLDGAGDPLPPGGLHRVKSEAETPPAEGWDQCVAGSGTAVCTLGSGKGMESFPPLDQLVLEWKLIEKKNTCGC